MEYISEHLSPFLTLKEVAVVLRIHPSDLDRIFWRDTGLTVKHYIDKLCREKVKSRMSQGCLKGSQLAFEFGFHSDQAFYRWIKRIFRIPFKELREIYSSSLTEEYPMEPPQALT